MEEQEIYKETRIGKMGDRMKKMATLLWVILLTSCKVDPEPIRYGLDACHYCSMTIVDQQHAAQLVTQKGKAFKFDSSECMMNHLTEVDDGEIALFLVNAYEIPGKLIDATRATYLISTNIPSPMGGNLSAFTTEDTAKRAKTDNGGELFSWNELREKFGNK